MRVFSKGAGVVAFATALTLAIACLFSTPAASAKGVILIQQADGETNVYHDVVIKIIQNVLYMTTSDGKGTLVISRAACSYQGQLYVCLATHATLVQSGRTSPLDFKHGTLYVNLTDDPQPLTASTQKVDPQGILLSFTTERGTYVNLTGRIDKVVK
ncbi:MAG TPA: hypothetical protein VFE16_01540 [Candidatus Cybelea sp.]|jgi:hypothetical protein|nr:hypothetical protein [Candidatus Cybelea sp.]